MSTLTQPRGQIAIGWAVVAGQRVPVICDPEWIRFFSTLTDRVGGTTGLSTTDIDAGSYAAMQPFAQEASYGDVLQLIGSASAGGAEVMQSAAFDGICLEVLQSFDSCAQASDVMQQDTAQLADYLPFQE